VPNCRSAAYTHTIERRLPFIQSRSVTLTLVAELLIAIVSQENSTRTSRSTHVAQLEILQTDLYNLHNVLIFLVRNWNIVASHFNMMSGDFHAPSTKFSVYGNTLTTLVTVVF
jgi:hypothetical protein